MRRFIAKSLICAGVLLGGSAVYAQSYGYPQYRYDPYYQQPRYERSYESSGGVELFERAADDLNRAAYDVYGSRGRINHARREVSDAQRQLMRGRFDRDEISEAIHAVQRVLDQDALPDQDRAALWQDVQQMRNFRSSGYGDRDRW